jgi:hypothetical protein
LETAEKDRVGIISAASPQSLFPDQPRETDHQPEGTQSIYLYCHNTIAPSSAYDEGNSNPSPEDGSKATPTRTQLRPFDSIAVQQCEAQLGFLEKATYGIPREKILRVCATSDVLEGKAPTGWPGMPIYASVPSRVRVVDWLFAIPIFLPFR